MNNAEIQIQFPQPGQWGDFTLTAIYRDADGYTRTDRYTQEDLPADQAPALASVVAALVGLVAGGAGVGAAGERCSKPYGRRNL